MHRIFTHGQIKKLFPWLKPRTLISWSERGLVVPDHGDARGRGSSRAYSYANLIEIIALSELLHLGMPFSVLLEIIGSDKLRATFRNENFDAVFYFRRSLSGAEVDMNVEPPWTGTYGVVPFKDFIENGGAIALDVVKRGKETLFGNPSLTIVLNLRGLKNFVDARIKSVL